MYTTFFFGCKTRILVDEENTSPFGRERERERSGSPTTMDSGLLAAIQKGRGLKKSPRRPSTARRQSAAKPAASNATTTTVSVCLHMPNAL